MRDSEVVSIAGLAPGTLRRGAGFATETAGFFGLFEAALLTVVGADADFSFVTGFAVFETGFDFSAGVGGVLLDLPIFIGGPCDLRLQPAQNYSPAENASN